MKVSANLPSATIFASKAMLPPSQQSQGGHRGFAQLLRGPNGARAATATWPILTVDTGANHFAIETKIGEDAVRFDARPIVAPTGDAKSAAHVDANHGASIKDAVAAAPTQAELESLVEQLAHYLPAIAEQLAKGPHPALPAATSAGPSHRTGPGPAAGATTEQLPVQGGHMPLPPTAKPAEAMPAKPTTAPPAAQTSPIAAQVASLPREVVIVLRGIALSAKERETLADIVQRELAPLRCSGRTIRIIGADGKA